MQEGTDEDRRRSVPANRVARERLGHGSDVDPKTGLDLPAIPTLYEAERRLMLIDQQLEEAVNDYSRISEIASSAKADWEEHRDLTIVELVNFGEKGAKDTRSALAKDRVSREGVPGEELYRVYLITEAALESKGRYLWTLQARLSGMQTMVNGLRKVTGL